MKLARVTWVDAHGDDEFHEASDLERLHKPRIVVSVGYLAIRNKIGVTLVRCLDDEHSADGRLFIDAGMIRRVEMLK